MKRHIILIPFLICLAFGPANAKTLGDFNNDGKLTIADAIAFIRVLMEKDPAGDVGQEYVLASECQEEQSELVGAWEQTVTEDGVTYYTLVLTFNSSGTWFAHWLEDENRAYEYGWETGTYTVEGNKLTINYYSDSEQMSEIFSYTIIDDTLTFYDQEGNAESVLKRRI